jgi:microcystin-dependent protein
MGRNIVITPNRSSTGSTQQPNISFSGLSAGTISHDLMGQSIILDSTKRLTLSSTIATNSIVPQRNTQYLKLPEYLSINSNEYTFPIGELGNNKYLKTDAVGRLSWSALGSNVNYFTYNSGGILPVGTIISTLTSTNLNTDWVICNGQLLAGVNYPELSAVIGTTFGGNTSEFRVPNLNNDMLYGTSSSPYNSTIYTFTSGTSANRSQLSAIGVNFFVKAKPDKVIKGTLQIDSPLNVTINGTNRNDTKISALTTLDSDVKISLPSSRIKVSYPLGVAKDLSDVTGSYVSIFNGDLDITGPTNTLKVDVPLKLTVDGTDRTGTAVSPYNGNLNIQLNTSNTIKVETPLSLTVDGSDKTGQTVDLDTPNQNMVVDLNFTNMMNTIYPVGSIIFSIDNITPQNRFGGTWVQISQGRFVVGVGTGNDGIQNKVFAAGNTTGEYEHQLTIAEMPNHTHGGVMRYPNIGGSITEQNQKGGPEDYVSFNQNTISTGGNGYHENTPPGFGMYVWQRTALA